MRVPRSLMEETERRLAASRMRREEWMAVWLGDREPCELYEPKIEAGPLHFVIPPGEVRALADYCARHGVRALGQVHTHADQRTRHSWVDDRDALPHRLGALSIVLPWCGRDGFAAPEVCVHELTAHGWVEVPRETLEIVE